MPQNNVEEKRVELDETTLAGTEDGEAEHSARRAQHVILFPFVYLQLSVQCRVRRKQVYHCS